MALTAVVALAGCAEAGEPVGSPDASPSAQPESTATPPAPAAPAPGEPTADPTPPADAADGEHTASDPPPVGDGYDLDPAEPAAALKQTAVGLVEALTTYEADDDLEAVAGRAAAGDAALATRLVNAAEPLHHAGAWSRGTIVYPQLGGLEAREAAVIVVVEQEIGLPNGERRRESRVLDVRVERGDDEAWRVDRLASAGGEPVARPDDLSPAATAVLDDDSIELPDTARWDVYRGRVDEDLLEVMARMAEHTGYGVVVLVTGHSREVFGTDRASKHSEGRAVDLYRLDDPLVVTERSEGSELHAFVRWLYDQPEIAEIGSPWALDGFGGRSFTDDLHQDHVHIGVYRGGG